MLNKWTAPLSLVLLTAVLPACTAVLPGVPQEEPTLIPTLTPVPTETATAIPTATALPTTVPTPTPLPPTPTVGPSRVELYRQSLTATAESRPTVEGDSTEEATNTPSGEPEGDPFSIAISAADLEDALSEELSDRSDADDIGSPTVEYLDRRVVLLFDADFDGTTFSVIAVYELSINNSVLRARLVSADTSEGGVDVPSSISNTMRDALEKSIDQAIVTIIEDDDYIVLIFDVTGAGLEIEGVIPT